MMMPVHIEDLAPDNLKEAVKLLSQHAAARIVTGGHRLMAKMKRQRTTPCRERQYRGGVHHHHRE